MRLFASFNSTPLLISHLKLLSAHKHTYLSIWHDETNRHLIINGHGGTGVCTIHAPLKSGRYARSVAGGCITVAAAQFIYLALTCDGSCVDMYVDGTDLCITASLGGMARLPFTRGTTGDLQYLLPDDFVLGTRLVCTIKLSSRVIKNLYIDHARAAAIPVIVSNNTLTVNGAIIPTLSICGEDCAFQLKTATGLQHLEARYKGTVLLIIRSDGTIQLSVENRHGRHTSRYLAYSRLA